MLPITVTCEELKTAICLDGAINVAVAAELKSALTDVFESGQELELEVSGVTEIDVCAMQLLGAAQQAWRTAQRAFSVHGPWSSEAEATLGGADLALMLTMAEAAVLSEV